SPAFAFMSFPLGNALSIQGMLTVIGSILGPGAVVVFSTTRTLTRLALQLMGVINSAVWPEISMAYASGRLDLARKLHRHSVQTSLWMSLGIILCFTAFGGSVLTVWTRGKVIVDITLFRLMLVIIFANTIWFTSSVVPAAINKHQR